MAYILVAILLVDITVLFGVRYAPEFFGESINEWYDKFKINAIISDVMVIALGFMISQYIYTELIYPQLGWNLPVFLIVLVTVQLLHDMFFNVFVIEPIPEGHNGMIDVFKKYASSGGYKILIADAILMLGSGVIASSLLLAPTWITVALGLLGMYTAPYILETVWHAQQRQPSSSEAPTPPQRPPPPTSESAVENRVDDRRFGEMTRL